LSDRDGYDEFRKVNALIRANFNVVPEQLSEDKWAELYQQALWVEKWRLRMQAEMLSSLFGGR
jgi:hypothetical protein